jgi:hypothetical protein
MEKRQKILLGLLGLAVLVFLLDRFVLSSKTQTAGAPAAGRTAQKNVQPGKEEVLLFSSAGARVVLAGQGLDPSVFRQWQRDPFVGAFTRALLDSLRGKKEEPLVLKAISWRDSTAYVIINDDVFREGETRGDITVLAVRDEKVFCLYRGRQYVLTLGDEP